MNPIEHVWPMISRKLIGRVFSDREQLWSALQTAFAEITPEQILKLYASMPRRIQALLANRGGSTRY